MQSAQDIVVPFCFSENFARGASAVAWLVGSDWFLVEFKIIVFPEFREVSRVQPRETRLSEPCVLTR